MAENEEQYSFKDWIVLSLCILSGGSLLVYLMSDQVGWLIVMIVNGALCGYCYFHLKDHPGPVDSSLDQQPTPRHLKH